MCFLDYATVYSAFLFLLLNVSFIQSNSHSFNETRNANYLWRKNIKGINNVTYDAPIDSGTEKYSLHSKVYNILPQDKFNSSWKNRYLLQEIVNNVLNLIEFAAQPKDKILMHHPTAFLDRHRRSSINLKRNEVGTGNKVTHLKNKVQKRHHEVKANNVIGKYSEMRKPNPAVRANYMSQTSPKLENLKAQRNYLHRKPKIHDHLRNSPSSINRISHTGHNPKVINSKNSLHQTNFKVPKKKSSNHPIKQSKFYDKTHESSKEIAKKHSEVTNSNQNHEMHAEAEVPKVSVKNQGDSATKKDIERGKTDAKTISSSTSHLHGNAKHTLPSLSQESKMGMILQKPENVHERHPTLSTSNKTRHFVQRRHMSKHNKTNNAKNSDPMQKHNGTKPIKKNSRNVTRNVSDLMHKQHSKNPTNFSHGKTSKAQYLKNPVKLNELRQKMFHRTGKFKSREGQRRYSIATSHPFEKEMHNLHDHSNHRSLKIISRSERNVLDEVRDFIVNNFMKSKKKRTSQNEEGNKISGLGHEVERREYDNFTNGNISVSIAKNRDSQILEEIKDFVVRQFHPKKSKQRLTVRTDNANKSSFGNAYSKRLIKGTSRLVKREVDEVTISNEVVISTSLDYDSYGISKDNQLKRDVNLPDTATEETNLNYFVNHTVFSSDQSGTQFSELPNTDEEYGNMTEDYFDITSEKISSENNSNSHNRRDFNSSKGKRENSRGHTSAVHDEEIMTSSVEETVSETSDIVQTAVNGDEGEITTSSNSYETDEALNIAMNEDNEDRSETPTGIPDSLNTNDVTPSVNDASGNRFEDFSETPESFNTVDDLNTENRRDDVIGNEMSSEASVALNGDVIRVTRAYEVESDTTSEMSDFISSNMDSAEGLFESTSKNWDISEETSTTSQFSLDNTVGTLSTASSINTNNQEEFSSTYTTVNEDFLTDGNSMGTGDIQTTGIWNAESRVPKELSLSSTDLLSSSDINEPNVKTSSSFDSSSITSPISSNSLAESHTFEYQNSETTDIDLSPVEASLSSETTIDLYESSSPLTSFTESPYAQRTMGSNTISSTTILEQKSVQTKVSRAIKNSRREEEYDYETPQVNFPNKNGKAQNFKGYPKHLKPELVKPDEIQSSSDSFQEDEDEFLEDGLEYVNDQPKSESSAKNKKMVNQKKETHFPQSQSDGNEKQKHGSIGDDYESTTNLNRVVKVNDRINSVAQNVVKNALSHVTKMNNVEKPQTKLKYKIKNHSNTMQNPLESHPTKNYNQKKNSEKLRDSKKVKKPTSNPNVATQISRKDISQNGEKGNAGIKSLKNEKNRKNVPESMKNSKGSSANKIQKQILRKTIKDKNLKHQPHYQNAPQKKQISNLEGTKTNNKAKISSKLLSNKRHSSSIKPEVKIRKSSTPMSHREENEKKADEEYDYDISSGPKEPEKEILFNRPTNRVAQIYQNSLHKNLGMKGTKKEDEAEYDYEDSPGETSKNSQREINSNVTASEENISPQIEKGAKIGLSTEDDDGCENSSYSANLDLSSTSVYSDSKLLTRHPKENKNPKSLDKKDGTQGIKTVQHENPQLGKMFTQHNEGISKVTEISNSIQNISAAGLEITSVLDVTEDSQYEYESPNETDYASNIISLETATALKSENLPRNVNQNTLEKTTPKTLQQEYQKFDYASHIPSSSLILEQITKKDSITVPSKLVRDKTHNVVHGNKNSNQNNNLKRLSHLENGTSQKHKKEMPVDKKYSNAFVTHAVTLQNLKIMPEGTTILTTGVTYTTTNQESSSFADENSNGTNEDYYDAITDGEQESNGMLKHQSGKNNLEKSVDELREVKDKANNLEEYIEDATNDKNDLLNYGSIELASSSDELESTTSDDYLQNKSESDFTPDTSEEVHSSPSSKLVENHNGKLRSYLRKLRTYLHSKHKHHINKRSVLPIQIKSRKLREVSKAMPTALPEFHTDHISPTRQWLFGTIGLLIVSSLIVAIYLSFMKHREFGTSFTGELKYDTGRSGSIFLTSTDVQINK